MSKFRFSIAFRITLNYAKLLFLYGAIFLFAFSIVFLTGRGRQKERQVEHFFENRQESGKLNASEIRELLHRGYEVEIVDENKKTLFTNISYSIKHRKLLFQKIYLNTNNSEHVLVVQETYKFPKDENALIYHIQYNMREDYEELMQILWKMIILYAIMCFIIVQRAKKENVKLLEPIKEMSQLAISLNVNNLSSERINIEGTQNELRDLANLINEMLDRMELSYESQKQFVSDASHELRTPIAVIQGYGNMLKRWGAKDEDVLKESIEAINNEAKFMQDLVEKLLFLSRHDKKTLKLDKRRFHMGPMIEEMVKETKLVAKNRIIECPSISDVVVYGDPQAIKQAIRVFIDNAIKYTTDGDTITISLENKHGDCVITVADTGIGMNRKDMDHIFQRFYRSDTVRNKNISGHGLGLSLAKLIVLAHVGRIKVRSQFTVGTSFTITIPKNNQ